MQIKNDKLKEALKIFTIVVVAIIYALFFKIIVEGRGFFATGGNGVAIIISRVMAMLANNNALESKLYMIIYIAINIPLFVFSYKKISKKFTIYTAIFIGVYSLMVGFIPESFGAFLGLEELDNLTSAVIIGLITGGSSAVTLFMGGCAGGLSIVSTYLNVKKGRSIGVYNLIFNTCILFVGFIIFNNIVSVIYTLVYAFFSSLVLDRYYNRNKKILLEIVTTKKDEISNYLLEHSHHGCTIINAQGAYTHEGKFVIHTVISWFQLKHMTSAIKELDPHCFVIDLNVYAVNGEFYIPPIN